MNADSTPLDPPPAAPDPAPAPQRTSFRFRFDLAAESIAVRIRWFGIVVGFTIVNFITPDLLPSGVASRNIPMLNTILCIGVVYVSLDTIWSARGQVFLRDLPLAVSLLEAVFIGLLCSCDIGQESPFRFYYFLSLVVSAMRYPPGITYLTFGLHSLSYSTLLLALPSSTTLPWVITVVSMGWVTWASTRLASLARFASDRLAQTNDMLGETNEQLEQANRQLENANQQLADANGQLEERIAQRTGELRESQAMLVQHEKQAAFGLLAAGIAHEVGNPLAAISSLVQMLRRRTTDDDDTRQRYQLIGDQVQRIQGIVRELVDFSRPANTAAGLCDVHAAIDAALHIAKYYKRRKGKRILTRCAENLPVVRAVRDQLVQVFLNLILNAMDAMPEGATLEISTQIESGWLRIAFRDTGVGIQPEHRDRLFEPYFTTKETGTGLGLFVCRQILERSGMGRIELTETGPAGTTVSVLITDDGLRQHPDRMAPEAAIDHQLSPGDSILPGAEG